MAFLRGKNWQTLITASFCSVSKWLNCTQPGFIALSMVSCYSAMEMSFSTAIGNSTKLYICWYGWQKLKNWNCITLTYLSSNLRWQVVTHLFKECKNLFLQTNSKTTNTSSIIKRNTTECGKVVQKKKHTKSTLFS